MEQLAATTVWFGEQVNAAADTVPRDETGLFAVSKEKILLNTGHVYDGIVAEYPFLAGPHRSPKPAFYSKLMSAAGFTGYLCPLFGESTLNVDCPAVFLPATHCARVQPPARRGGRAGSKLCGDPGFHHLW
mgnify:FL=1